MSSKNAALKNNLAQLRKRNKAEKLAGGGTKVGDMERDSSARAQARKTARNLDAISADAPPPKPSWSEMPEVWQRVALDCLADRAKDAISSQPRAEGLTEAMLAELLDFVSIELKEPLAAVLLPTIRIFGVQNGGNFDEAMAIDMCSKVVAAPAFSVEMEPLCLMALTYMQTRATH